MSLKWNYRNLPITIQQLAIVFLLASLAFWTQSGFSVDLNHALFIIANYLTWLLLLPSISHQSKRVTQRSGSNLLTLLLSALFLIFLHWVISNLMLGVIKVALFGLRSLDEWKELPAFLVPSLVTRLIDFSLLLGLLSWLHQQKEIAAHQVAEIENLRLLKEVELASLRSQLNPHFLFNALHNVNSQIGFDDQKARKLIRKISDFLRQVLSLNHVSEHSIKEELDMLQLYLDIEKERFADRLIIEQSISEQARKVNVPVMILQPLIENAFKHGIAHLTGESVLELIIAYSEDSIHIKVINPTPPSPVKSQRTGTGLSNLRNRLHGYYGTSVNFTHEQKESTFTVNLHLPL